MIPSCVGLSGRNLWRSGENATELDLNYPLDRGTTMRTSTARYQRSWEPYTMFVCFALLAAASFEIQGLVKDLQSVSAREQSEFQSDARSGGENDQSSRPEELTSRNHDESEKGGSDPSLLQAIDAPHQSSAPSIRPIHHGTTHGATRRSVPSAPPWTLRSRPRLRSCVLSKEVCFRVPSSLTTSN